MLALKQGRKIPNYEKKCSKSEEPNIIAARKSIVASKNIKTGEYFSQNNISTKRPGIGISPMMWDKVIGSIANKDYEEDDMI